MTYRKIIAGLPIAFLASIIVAMFFYEMAKAWLSISMIGMLLATFATISIKQTIINFYQNKPFFLLALSGAFLLLFLPNSNNLNYGLNRIELRGAVLGLCIAFANLQPISKKTFTYLIGLYIALAVCFVTFVLYGYAKEYEVITQSYLRAKVMPTPLNHIRFSLMVAMAAYFGYVLAQNRFIKAKWLRAIVLLSVIYLILFLHAYAVRSGLVAFYVLVVFETIRLWIIHHKKLPIIVLGVMLSVLVFASPVLFPSLNNKMENTKADYITYRDKTYPNYSSLTTRLISFDAAWFIFVGSPIMGCGIGDIKDQTDAYFKKFHPEIETPILPHNQFFFFLSATGLLGLIIFLGTFYAPLWYDRYRHNKLVVGQYLVLGVAFMTEPMLETQLGMAYSIIFLLIPMALESDGLCLLQSK